MFGSHFLPFYFWIGHLGVFGSPKVCVYFWVRLLKIVIFFSVPRCCIACLIGSMGGYESPAPYPSRNKNNLTNKLTNLKGINMKFLMFLIVVVVVTIKTIFGFVDMTSEVVYDSSHKTETYLEETLN